MSRADALRKLLALGDLAWCEIAEIMGGNVNETRDALEALRVLGVVELFGACQFGVRYRLVGGV